MNVYMTSSLHQLAPELELIIVTTILSRERVVEKHVCRIYCFRPKLGPATRERM